MCYRLGFSNFDQSSTSQAIIVDATRKLNDKEIKKEHVVNHHKMPYDRNNFYVNKRNHIFRSTCFYYNEKVHTYNACYIRKYDIPYGEYVWVREDLT